MTGSTALLPRSLAPFGGAPYAIFQAGFWLLIAGLMCIAIQTGLPSDAVDRLDPATREAVIEKLAIIRPGRWVSSVTLPLTGFLLSHVLHLISTRWRWADRPLRQLVPIAATACFLLSAFGFLLDEHVTGRWLRRDQLPGSGFSFTLGDGSVPGFWVLCSWMVIYYAYQAFSRIAQMELAQMRQDAAIRDSRLDAITTQLNPHFLFNSLNTVRGLIEESPASARDAVTHLAHVLRVSLASTRQRLVPMDEELETVHAHLMLELARHGTRLSITGRKGPGVQTARVPPLLLQTLVENAVKHGVAAHPGPGFVYYEATLDDDLLKLTVRNSGTLELGWDEPGKGLGLIHTRERLELLFPGTGALTISGEEGIVTVVAIIPQHEPATFTKR